MKKSKKFFVSALFSVLGTIGIAGCDMGNNSQNTNGTGNQSTFKAAVRSNNFLKELRGSSTVGGFAMEATLNYFSYQKGDKPFVAPKNFDRTDINWESVTVTDATYLKDSDGLMIGLVSVAVYGIFDNTNFANYVYTVEITNDGSIIKCVINSDVSKGVWAFLMDGDVKKQYLGYGVKITNLTNRVIGITANGDGKLNVGETSKEAQEAGFQLNWVMNGKLFVNGDDGRKFSITVSNGAINSIQ